MGRAVFARQTLAGGLWRRILNLKFWWLESAGNPSTSWAAGDGQPFKEIVRQQYTFTPGSREIEDYVVNSNGFGILELEIMPASNSHEIKASLTELRLG